MTTILGTQLGTQLGTYLGTGEEDSAELQSLENYLSYNLFSWIRADYRAESGGKVTAFWDKVADGIGARAVDPSHALSQGSGALQVASVTASALINNREVGTFTGAQRYVSTIAAANWPIQDGTGWSVLLLLVPKQAGAVTESLLSTHTATTTGFNLYYAGAGHAPDWGIYNVGGVRVSAAAAGGGLVPDAATYIRGSYAEGASPEILFSQGGVSVISANSTGAPTAGAPMNTLTLGALISGAQAANFLFADMLVYKTASLANIQRYALLRYGVVVS